MKKFKKIIFTVFAMTIGFMTAVGTVACNNSNNTVLATKLTVNPTSLELKVGETATLEAMVNLQATDRTVSWFSNDASIATVNSEGKVEAKAAGTTKIGAKTNDGSNLTATCDVTVKEVATLKLSVNQKNMPTAPDMSLASGTLKFYTDGTYEVSSFFMAQNISLIFDGEYSVDGEGNLSFTQNKEATSSFGPGFMSYIAPEVVGDKIVIYVSHQESQLHNEVVFELNAQEAAVLGAAVGAKKPVTGIAANPLAALLGLNKVYVGKSIDVSTLFTVSPDDASDLTCTYEITQGNDYATLVGSLLITNNLPGTVTVQATTNDGNFTATVDVIVQELPARPASFDSTKVCSMKTVYVCDLAIMTFEITLEKNGTYAQTMNKSTVTSSGYYTYEENGTTGSLSLLDYKEINNGQYDETKVVTLPLSYENDTWNATLVDDQGNSNTFVKQEINRPIEFDANKVCEAEMVFKYELDLTAFGMGKSVITFTFKTNGVYVHNVEGVGSSEGYYTIETSGDNGTIKIISLEDLAEGYSEEKVKTLVLEKVNNVWQFTYDGATIVQVTE